jgi:hypothetical protein
MTKYDSWLESGAHDGEDEEIFRENREAELLNDECDPTKVENIVEALQNECLEPHKDALEEAFISNDKEKIGTIIRASVCEYWELQAEKFAYEEWINQ